ncbi:MAG: ester cyclase [Chloroflexi bacterium]|nr:ester cyclase [Chloroflexota bacterium]
MNAHRKPVSIAVLTIAFAAVLAFGVGTYAQQPPAFSAGLTDDMASDFVQSLDAIFNTPDLSLADNLFADDFVAHMPLSPDLDREGWKDYFDSLYGSFPDLRQTTNKFMVAGDHLIMMVTYSGRHQDTFFGVDATCNASQMDGIGVFRFEGGRPVEAWVEMDLAGLIFQTRANDPRRGIKLTDDSCYDPEIGMRGGIEADSQPAFAQYP